MLPQTGYHEIAALLAEYIFAGNPLCVRFLVKGECRRSLSE